MKSNFNLQLKQASESYSTNIESINNINKSISKIHSTNGIITNNLINRTQNLLNHSFNIIKSHTKGNLDRLKEFSSNLANDNANNKSIDHFSTGNQDSSKIF